MVIAYRFKTTRYAMKIVQDFGLWQPIRLSHFDAQSILEILPSFKKFHQFIKNICFYSLEEIKIFWKALDKAPISKLIQLALKLLLTTAQRKHEVVSAEWSEIDFNTRIWTIPAGKAKNKMAHRVPLSQLALELLWDIGQTITKRRKCPFP